MMRWKEAYKSSVIYPEHLHTNSLAHMEIKYTIGVCSSWTWFNELVQPLQLFPNCSLTFWRFMTYSIRLILLNDVAYESCLLTRRYNEAYCPLFFWRIKRISYASVFHYWLSQQSTSPALALSHLWGIEGAREPGNRARIEEHLWRWCDGQCKRAKPMVHLGYDKCVKL